MKRQFFTGNTLEQAVLAAARQIGVEPERVAFKPREKKHGFLKVRRRVVIEVDMESPVLPEGMKSVELSALPSGGPPSPPPLKRESSSSAGREPEPPEVEEEELAPPSSESEAIRRAFQEILRFLRLEAEISLHRGEDGFEVELLGEDAEVLTRDEGQVLQSMEYLVPRMVRGWLGHGVPVRVDCEGFRASRAAELEALAARVAEQVLRDGAAQCLDPMSPADRRLVHLALAEHPDVETESEGDGYYKRVRITPVVADLDDSMSFGKHGEDGSDEDGSDEDGYDEDPGDGDMGFGDFDDPSEESAPA